MIPPDPAALALCARSELRNIIPYVNTTDYIVNSAMPYEMPMYKAKLFKEFAQWTEAYAGDPLRKDAYERASRVYKLMQALEPIEDDLHRARELRNPGVHRREHLRVLNILGSDLNDECCLVPEY